MTSVFSVVKYRTYAEGIAWHLCNVEVNRVAFSVCELIGWKFLVLMCWRIVSTALSRYNQAVPLEVSKPAVAHVAA